MLFNGWGSIGRVVLAGVAAYAVLILMLRLSGKRTTPRDQPSRS